MLCLFASPTISLRKKKKNEGKKLFFFLPTLQNYLHMETITKTRTTAKTEMMMGWKKYFFFCQQKICLKKKTRKKSKQNIINYTQITRRNGIYRKEL